MDTTNGYQPEVGDLVWQQMYSPTHPHWGASIEERIAGGVLYGPRRLMRVAGIIAEYDSTAYSRGLGRDIEPKRTQRWHLVDPERPNAESRMSWVESDWCVLENASADVGMLF